MGSDQRASRDGGWSHCIVLWMVALHRNVNVMDGHTALQTQPTLPFKPIMGEVVFHTGVFESCTVKHRVSLVYHATVV